MCIRDRSLGYDLVIVETAGIGQSDSEIVDLVDFPMYVMTSDFGAPSQLEKIDMLDYAELVVLNKFDKRGAEDALRDVRKQWKRNRVAFQTKDEDVPVYPTIASPVSYTHLDVYKRQTPSSLRARPARRGAPWMTCSSMYKWKSTAACCRIASATSARLLYCCLLYTSRCV